MSAIVDYEYYSTVYMGTEAEEASFPALCARASDVVGSIARWQVTADNIGTFPELVQTLYKKAVCAQIDYFAVNGLDSVAGGTDRGFTVGKVSVSGRSGSEFARNGAMSDHLSPMVIMYLEQSGLMGPQVATAPDVPVTGWWY
jgi:hypothetical protein